jgi:NH3-dependent NAD+ synthetase
MAVWAGDPRSASSRARPSAELRPDQTDQDSLPPYEVLDAILARYMEEDQGIEDIIAAGFARADVERVTRLIKLNEYKRRQAPVGIRITHRAFRAGLALSHHVQVPCLNPTQQTSSGAP